MENNLIIRNARPEEFGKIGQMMVEVYSGLENFLSPAEHPGYYQLLANIGEQTNKPQTELLVAEANNKVMGGVVYIGDMRYYGSGGSATKELEAAGCRFLAVDQAARGLGIGKSLTLACIEKAKSARKKNLIIHTTIAMKKAWQMYERIGFVRAEELDFPQGNLQVYGFRFFLENPHEKVNNTPLSHITKALI